MRQILEDDGVRFEEVDGEGPVEVVTERIEKILKQWELTKTEEN